MWGTLQKARFKSHSVLCCTNLPLGPASLLGLVLALSQALWTSQILALLQASTPQPQNFIIHPARQASPNCTNFGLRSLPISLPVQHGWSHQTFPLRSKPHKHDTSKVQWLPRLDSRFRGPHK